MVESIYLGFHHSFSLSLRLVTKSRTHEVENTLVSDYSVKKKRLFQGDLTCSGCESNRRSCVFRFFLIDLTVSSATVMKSSHRDHWNDISERRSWKITENRTTPLFFKIDLCSATSMESSRRDQLNDMAEHRSILKNNRKKRTFPLFFKIDQTHQKKALVATIRIIWLNMGLTCKIIEIRTTPVLFPHAKRARTLEKGVPFKLCRIQNLKCTVNE